MITLLKKKNRGFTLLEMLLVIVIFSSILVMATRLTTQNSEQFRRDKTIMQIQTVLNAGITYYQFYGAWPANIAALSSAGYIPTNMKNPYGFTYIVSSTSPQNMFSVTATTNSATNAKAIANQLPNALVTTTTVKVSTSLPASVLNSARSLKYGAIYASGACVPAPTCATAGMKAAIYVMPASVNGVSNADPSIVYPLTSYVAFARGDASNNPSTLPLDCAMTSTATPKACQSLGSTDPATQTYWRVCLSVMTNQGRVMPTNATTGLNLGSILAVTRCVPNSGTENITGTKINVWTPNNNP